MKFNYAMFSILTPSIPIWGGLPLYWDGIGPPPQASLGIGGPLSPCKGNEKELKSVHTCKQHSEDSLTSQESNWQWENNEIKI